MLRLILSCLAICLACSSESAGAQPYPTRPIKVVVGFPAGGPPDILARILSAAISETLGQNVFVENTPGASGTIATGQVSRATPDGYTLMVGSIATHATNAAMYKKLPYDPVTGFTPIALLAESPLVLVVHPGFPARSVADLIEAARKGDLTYGSNSYGGTAHLCAELLQLRAGIKMTHVPYRGSAPMLLDLVAGRIPVAFDNMPPSMPFIQDGQTRLLAVTSSRRSALFPEVPTFSEAGVTDFSASAWYGIFAPPGLPRPIADTLQRAFLQALRKPDVRARLEALSFAIIADGPDALTAKVVSEMKTWSSVVEANGIERQ